MHNIRTQLRKFIVDNFMFGTDNGFGDDTSFLKEGIMDSTGALELITFLEETFGIHRRRRGTAPGEPGLDQQPLELPEPQGHTGRQGRVRCRSTSEHSGPGTLVHHFLEQSAARLPDKTAVVYEDTRASYAQIEARANGFASWLAANGTRKGDRVVLLLENSPDYIVGYYGILKAGAVAVPLSPDLKADALKPLLDELEPSAIVSSARCEQALKELWPVSAPSARLVLKSPKLQWPAAAIDWEDVSAARDPG